MASQLILIGRAILATIAMMGLGGAAEAKEYRTLGGDCYEISSGEARFVREGPCEIGPVPSMRKNAEVKKDKANLRQQAPAKQ